MEPLKVLLLAAVLLGAAILVLSFTPTRRIYLETRRFPGTWLSLLGLISVFLCGYLLYAWILLRRTVEPLDILTAAIFLAGACFVWIVSQLSQVALREIRRLTALEKHRSSHDPLTRLPNRVFFARWINEAVRMPGCARGLAVLMIDMKRFKLINDTLGYYYGDLLLQEIALRLHRSLRKTDVLARLGGDEFGVLINPLDDPGHLEQIARHLVVALDEPIPVEGYPADVGVSIGIALSPDHGGDAATLMKHAKLAVYEAKRINADKVIYSPAFDAGDLDDLNIMSELRQAIESNTLEVHFQPQVDLRTRQICGFEALIRWPHPRFGLLSPEKFVPLAEQGGLINLLNDKVLDIVLDQLAAWQQRDINLPISTNVSAVNLQDDVFFQKVIDGITQRSLRPGGLRLEVTETAFISDLEHVADMIKKLVRFGVEFAIDDFGTGYSSLEYLKQIPVNELKIDKSFVLNAGQDENDTIIIRSAIDLAHRLGLQATAEGIETREALELLQALGCDKLQGFYIGQAMTIEAIEDKLARGGIDMRSLLYAG